MARASRRVEGSQNGVTVTLTDGTTNWHVRTPDNVVARYGSSPQSRLSDPEDRTRVFEWRLEEARDEAELNLLQLQHVQEELEFYFLAHQQQQGLLLPAAAALPQPRSQWGESGARCL